MKSKDIIRILDEYIPNPKCPLNYNKDYELLIAVMLSAQTTDNQVNRVTEVLFDKYNIYTLATAQKEDIANIIKPCGTMNKKSEYIIKIAQALVNDYNGKVPNNREYLESLQGIGHKSTNVVLANLFGENAFAVDTHISRVAKRFGIADNNDNVITIENKLMNYFNDENWNKLHHQMLLFGRYKCKSKNPECGNCKFKCICTKEKEQ